MTTTDRVEFLLRRAVAVNPSDEGLRRLDERVARIMSGAVSTQPRARATRVRFVRPLALAAALLLAAGAVGASLGLLDQAIDQSALPGWRVAWDRAEVIGQRQTDAGVTVTLERAYADVNQVLVGFTVEGLESPTLASGMKDSLAWTADLRDPAGRTAEQWATSSHAQGRDVTGLSAVIQTWLGVPLATAGTWELTVTSVGYGGSGFVPGECTVGATEPQCVNPVDRMVHGTWRFAFDLPVPAGALVVGPFGQTVGSATVTLTELRVGPSAITSRLALIVDGEAVSYWGPTNASVRFNGSSYGLSNATHITTDPAAQGPYGDENEFPIDTGVAAPAGTWLIEVPELWYVTGDADAEAAITLRGPWILEVTVP
jgi:hypothetical protein